MKEPKNNPEAEIWKNNLMLLEFFIKWIYLSWTSVETIL